MKSFHLTREHIKLLQALPFFWDSAYDGAITMNSKRPFGFSGRPALVSKIAEILDIKPQGSQENFTEAQESYLLELWYGTLPALEIITDTESFTLGIYEYEEYEYEEYEPRNGRWHLVTPD